MVGEDGNPLGQIPLTDVVTETMGGSVRKHEGAVTIEMTSGDALEFLGVSESIDGRPGAAMLEIRGRIE